MGAMVLVKDSILLFMLSDICFHLINAIGAIQIFNNYFLFGKLQSFTLYPSLNFSFICFWKNDMHEIQVTATTLYQHEKNKIRIEHAIVPIFQLQIEILKVQTFHFLHKCYIFAI